MDHGRLLLILAGVGTGFALGVAALVLPIDTRAEILSPTLLLQFQGKSPAHVSLSDDRREVVVTFIGEVSDGAVKAVSKELGDLLYGYTKGYGSVRFLLNRPVQARLETTAGGNLLVIQPEAVQAAAPADARRLATLQAQALAADNPKLAQVKLADALQERPNDLDLLLALAGVEQQAGDWRGGLRSYDRALTAAPDASDITQQREALALRYGPTLHVDTSAIFGPGERDQLGTLSARIPLAPGWAGFATLLSQHSSIDNLRQSGSDLMRNYDAAKLQGRIGIERQWTPALTTTFDVTGAPQTLGGGLSQRMVWRYGTTTISANDHTPYWETLTSFAANAHRDSLGVTHALTTGPWELSGGFSGLRYGIPRDVEVASGVGVDASLTRKFAAPWIPEGWRTDIGYRFDAEYLDGVKTAPSGASEALLPLLDVRKREVHTIEATALGEAGPGLLTAITGYSIDRFGGSGPEALLRYARRDDDDPLTFGIEAATNPSLDFKTRQLYRIGGFATWRLGLRYHEREAQ